MKHNITGSRLFVSIQILLLLFGVAWIAYTIVSVPEVIFASPFPKGEGVAVPTVLVLLFMGCIVYVLSAFRNDSYWRRFSIVFLFLGVASGIFYLLAFLSSPQVSLWLVYILAAGFIIFNRWSENTFVHNFTQIVVILGIVLFMSTRMTTLQGIILLIFFSLYDIVASFFPRHLFAVIAQIFRVDYSISIALPHRLHGWLRSHHTQTENFTPIRSLDIVVPLLFIILIAFPYHPLLYWMMVAGWSAGIISRLWLKEKFQAQLFLPLLGITIGFILSLFLLY